jgi:hypothetical protein
MTPLPQAEVAQLQSQLQTETAEVKRAQEEVRAERGRHPPGLLADLEHQLQQEMDARRASARTVEALRLEVGGAKLVECVQKR